MLLLAIFVACFGMLSAVSRQLVSWLVNEVERMWKEDKLYWFTISAFARRVAGVPSEIQSERRPNTSFSEHMMVLRSFTSCSIVGSDISQERADFVFRLTPFSAAEFWGGAMPLLHASWRVA